MNPGSEFKPADSVTAGHAAAILAALRQGPRTTSELRAMTGAMSPAARVLDLRNAGHRVVTCRAGRQARYMLSQEGSA